jgi:hypothetical protein
MSRGKEIAPHRAIRSPNSAFVASRYSPFFGFGTTRIRQVGVPLQIPVKARLCRVKQSMPVARASPDELTDIINAAPVQP